MAVQDQWYCGVDGQQYGPYTWDQLRAMAAEGRIVPQTYVRRAIDPQWLSAAQIPGLLARKKPAAKAPPASSDSSAAVSGGKSKKLRLAKPLAATVTPVAGPGAGGAIPVGQAVPPAPAAVPAPPVAGIAAPVGVPVGFAINTDSSSKSAAAVAGEIEPRKKGSSLVLIGILGGAAMAVAIVGVALVSWTWSRPPAPGGNELAATQPAPEAPAAAEEANPAVATPIAPAAASDAAAEAKRVLAAQPKWGNVEVNWVKVNDVHLKVTGVWLAADEAGAWVEPTLPSAAASADSAAATPGKYVFVEVRLFNGGDVPRRFRSWNVLNASAAVLADDEGNVLAPVPAAATPGLARLSSLRLMPNQAAIDTLVFEAPDDPFEKLRLAIGYSALSEINASYLALEVPVEVMFRKRGDVAQEAATLAGGPLPPAGAAPAAFPTGTVAAGVSADDAVMPAKEAKTDKPPSIAELNRQFEEYDKTTPAAGSAPQPAAKADAPKTDAPKPAAESPFQPVEPKPAAAESPFQPVAPAAEPAKPAEPPQP